MKLTRILVPIDFSVPARKALDYAVELARPFKAQLVVLHVVEPIYYAAPDLSATAATTVDLIDVQRRSARKELARLQARYAKRDVALRGLVQVGTPFQEITSTAKTVRASLICMATHGRSGVLHLLLGSVAERVVRFAECPVLTIRVPAPGKAKRTKK